MCGRVTSSTDWGCRQNGEPTPKHALNRRNSRKMTLPKLEQTYVYCALYGAPCWRSMHKNSTVPSGSDLVRIPMSKSRRNSRSWALATAVARPRQNPSKLRLYSRVVVCEIKKIEVDLIDFSRPSPLPLTRRLRVNLGGEFTKATGLGAVPCRHF